jgi:hypothetical protein
MQQRSSNEADRRGSETSAGLIDGKLGSMTYHFLDNALGTTLPSDASGIQSHGLYTWADGGRFYATRDAGC